MRKEESLISNLAETFKNLNRYKIKLNPTKCSFGVSAGQLLGFLVSARGIEANPKKSKQYWQWENQQSYMTYKSSRGASQR
jgi:hypothetical protein